MGPIPVKICTEVGGRTHYGPGWRGRPRHRPSCQNGRPKVQKMTIFDKTRIAPYLLRKSTSCKRIKVVENRIWHKKVYYQKIRKVIFSIFLEFLKVRVQNGKIIKWL
jgi:hypothetical protein